MLRIDSLDTPLGTIHLAARGDALVALNFGAPLEGERARTEAAERLRAYFEGDVRALDELRVDPAGTPFQKRVWALLREIPAGETRSYSELAGLLGSHPRALGAANGANPVALVIPCHRVIAKAGSSSTSGRRRRRGSPSDRPGIRHDRDGRPLARAGGHFAVIAGLHHAGDRAGRTVARRGHLLHCQRRGRRRRRLLRTGCGEVERESQVFS